MGCDIHFFVEKKEDGRWKSCDTWEESDGYCHNRSKDRIYSDRNYTLFAILANVRNYIRLIVGKSDEKFNPIAPAKGLPEDVTREVKSYCEDGCFAGDLHNHTWYTLKELQDFNWDTPAPRSGFPEGETYGSLCQQFREEIMDDMLKLAPEGNPENVRCIIAFDN